MAHATVREHQMALLDMLHEIDRICSSNGIAYQLFAGTALGAVRHQGFIPWDDDLDVIMLRKDYDRFLELAPGLLGDEYFLQCEFSEHWPMFFSKLRRNGTACMEKTHPRDRLQHQGIYVDIFPADTLSEYRLGRLWQFLASKVVIGKCLGRRGYLTDSWMKKLFIELCKPLPRGPFLRAVQARRKDTSRVHSFLGASSRYEHSVYPREWLADSTRVPFEDGLFPVSSHYDEMLTTLYGDWRRIPPPEERRCKVHAMLVDLDHSWEQYVDWQAQQKITEYTRSIR